jgi:hypothetical protein
MPHRVSCTWPAPNATMTAVPQPSAVKEANQREHLRLLNEYLASCKGSNCDARIRPLSLYFAQMAYDDGKTGPSHAKEFFSFLPPNRSGESRYRKASAPSSIAGLCHRGRDAPASSSRAPARTRSPPRASPERPRHQPHGGATLASPTARDEGSVYRSQVATALNAGRSVWL